MSATFEAGRFGSGREVQRIDDPGLVAGRGRYSDDMTLAGQAYLAFARSPYAHARIRAIDKQSAMSLPGVLGVFTGADLVAAGVKPIPVEGFHRPDGSPMATPPRRPLAHEAARYVGEAVVAVVAETKEAARAAAESVFIDYEELPSVTDPLDALKPGAPVLWEKAPDNITACMKHGDAAATERAFETAAHTVAIDVVNQRLAPSPMEPRSVLAYLDGERLTVRLSSQMPTAVRTGLCTSLGMAEQQVRVLVGDVGGGFGMKTGIYPEDIAVGYAARALKRPVRWTAERMEEFLSAFHGRDCVSRAELALDADGKATALRVRTTANVGAYATGAGVAIPLMVGPWVSTSIYDIPTIDVQITAVLTNRASTGPYRGAGRPEAIYLIERLMDAAARKLAMDPAELRRRSVVRPGQMPYKSAMAQVYDSGEFEKILDQGLALADWNGFEARRAQSKARGKLLGRGIAAFLEWTGGLAFDEKCAVEVTGDGCVEITSATLEMGQGIQTSYAQLAVDVFGVPIDRIRIVQGDTDRANGFGSAASRSLFTGGAAVHVASQKTVETAKSLAAESLEVSAADVEYLAGRFVVAGTDLGIGLFELAAAQPGARIHGSGDASAAGPSWPNACHVCEVEIDPATGEIEIVAYASVNDIGRIVSPTIVRGQIEGGAVQGIGQALGEQMVYDRESGQLLTATFMDYAMPKADGFRAFKTAFDESIPCKANLLGAKGVGELGTIGATPAVMNAVVDALASSGLGAKAERIQMPVTSERAWRALRGDFG